MFTFAGDVEFLLGLEVYHATAACSQETVVMSLHRPHFERLFRRRNPRTVKEMARTLELQMTRRVVKPNIVNSTPLLKCFIYKIQELTGERRYGDENTFAMPNVVFEMSQNGRRGSRAGAQKLENGTDVRGSATNQNGLVGIRKQGGTTTPRGSISRSREDTRGDRRRDSTSQAVVTKQNGHRINGFSLTANVT